MTAALGRIREAFREAELLQALERGAQRGAHRVRGTGRGFRHDNARECYPPLSDRADQGANPASAMLW